MRIAVSDRLHLENELRTALDADALEVAYQPIVRLSDGATTGAEALARWTHPTLGPVAPDVFIAVAEETGLIDALGERVLARACRDATAWIEAIPDFRLSVNLSPCQLRAADFVPRLERVLAESGLPHRNLTLEVTESAVLSMDTRTRENLDRLVRSGIGLALDDFGIGHSSLAQLRRVPFDVIKIDRSFMIDRSPTGDAIIGAVASIGLATGARVLAEGIENAEHDDRAQRLGCGYGQGWHFGRPVPAAELACHIGVLRLAADPPTRSPHVCPRRRAVPISSACASTRRSAAATGRVPPGERSTSACERVGPRGAALRRRHAVAQRGVEEAGVDAR